MREVLTGRLPLAPWDLYETPTVRGGKTMSHHTIQWESDLPKALARAKTENRPVLLDFFNPG